MQLVESHSRNFPRQNLFLNEIFDFRHRVQTKSHRERRGGVGATDRKPPERHAELRIQSQHREKNAGVEGHEDHEDPLDRGRIHSKGMKGESRGNTEQREGCEVDEGEPSDQAQIDGH
jgi:hypothetical protein